MPTRRTRTVGTVAALALAAGTFTLLPGAAPTAAADTLVAYTGCEELLAYYRSELAKGSMSYAPPPPGMPSRLDSAGAPAAEGRGAAQDAVGSGPTGTNVQERGVDEPDSAKTVGGLLFAFSEDRLQIVRTGAQPTVLSSFPLDGPAYGAELLVQDDRVLVLLPSTATAGIESSDTVRSSPLIPPDGGAQTIRLMLLDVGDPTAPRLVETLDLTGRYLSARLSGGAVRLVTASTPTLPRTPVASPYGPAEQATATDAYRSAARSATVEQVLPRELRREAGGRVLSDEPAVPCDQVRHASVAPQGAATLLVTTLDLGRTLAATDRTAVTTDGELVYASADRLYVATSRWGTAAPAASDGRLRSAPVRTEKVTTELHAFDTSAATRTRYAGSGSVEGYVYGRWALSSYDGSLRVATTSAPPWNGAESPSASSVTVLEERPDGLVETGRLGGLGKGERIFAVRYFGELATVVTFRQTDPLYVIDLADPKNPRLLGELKVPGFSTYLHPVGGDRLLGLGQDADATGRVTGLQVSLFDLSDRSKPVRLDQLSLGSGYTPAMDDSRAFGYDPERRLALLPLSTYDMTKNGSGVASNEALGIRVTENGKLEPAGRLPVGPQVQLERVLHDGDNVYAVSRTGVVAGRGTDLGRTGSVDFRR